MCHFFLNLSKYSDFKYPGEAEGPIIRQLCNFSTPREKCSLNIRNTIHLFASNYGFSVYIGNLFCV